MFDKSIEYYLVGYSLGDDDCIMFVPYHYYKNDYDVDKFYVEY